MSPFPGQPVLPFILLLFTLEWSSSLKIVNLAVPLSVPNTTESAILLDCDYSLELSSVQGLVVKWFLNDAPNPVYQWIEGRRPQDLGLLKGRVDLNYRASEDPRKMYRALRIKEPSGELSGDYTCTVSTFDDEARQTKRMTIYTPASRFEFWSEEGADEEVTLRCLSQGVSPEPLFNITTAGSGGGTGDSFKSWVELRNNTGLWEAEARLKLNKKELQSRTGFICRLSIPGTDYSLSKSIYIPSARPKEPAQREDDLSLVTAPNHYDPDIFFIRAYTEETSSGSSVEAAAFSIFLLSFLTSVRA